MNKILEPATRNDPIFITNYNLIYPIKESSIRQQMNDLDFKYSLAKKLYVIMVHEREDVQEDRKIKAIIIGRRLLYCCPVLEQEQSIYNLITTYGFNQFERFFMKQYKNYRINMKIDESKK